MISWIKWRWNNRNYYGVRPTKHGFQIYHRTKYWFVFRRTVYWNYLIGGWSVNKDDLYTCRTSFLSVMKTLVILTKFKYEDIEFIEILSRGKVI